MKKALSLLLMLCISFSCFSACSKTEFIIDENEELDFRGGKFIFAISDRVANIGNFPPKRGEYASMDRVLDRFEETEKKFNLTFEFRPNTNPSVDFLSAALTGGEAADIFYTCNKYLYDAYLLNTLLPAELIVNDPESEKWKSTAINAKRLYGDKIYGLFPNYWEFSPDTLGLINVNMNRLSEYNIVDPHEMIEAGEWNWENFRVFLQQTAFKDGETEWLGMGVPNGLCCLFPFVLSNGGSFVAETNGIYTLNINSPEAMEAYDFIADLGSLGLITLMPDTDDSYSRGDKWMITSGEPGMSRVFDVGQFRFPYGPKGNKDTVSTMSTDLGLMSFPVFSAYAEEEIGEVAEFMFEPLSEEYPNGWKDTTEEAVFYYHSEFEYYLKGVEEAEYIDIYIFKKSQNLLNSALLNIFSGNSAVSDAIETIYDTMNEEISAQYNK